MRRTNILLLSAGRRVELLQSFLAARDLRLPDAQVFAADARPETSAACHIADAAFRLPLVNSDGYARALLELCEARQVGLVIPTIDTELSALASLRDSLEQKGIFALVSGAALIADCRDKRRTAGLFRRHRVDTPELYDRDAIRFPCFTKPYDGSSGIGAFRLMAPEDLSDAMRGEAKRMFMELVPPSFHEVTVDLYYDRRSRLRCVVPRVRLEVRAGEVSKGVTRRNWICGYLQERLGVLEGARGCITLQLFASDDRLVKAIEINPRFGGGYPLTHAAGADYVGWAIDEYLLGKEIPDFDAWSADLLMLRYDAKILVRDYADG